MRENYDKHFTEWLEVLRQKCSKEDWKEFVTNLGLSHLITEDEEIETVPADEEKQLDKNDEPQTSQDTKIPTTTEQDDVYEDFMAELEAEQQQSIAEAKEREVMKKRYEDHLEEEMWELNRTMKSVFSSKTCA